MNIEDLIPYNGKTIQTKKLNELGYAKNDINKMLNEGLLERVRRGYYQINLKCDIDVKLMKYYLMNGYYTDFKQYFNRLPIKDYDAYYYDFLCDVITNNYNEAYESLVKCCELNVEESNRINLYAYVLLLDQLIKLDENKIEYLKEKIFDKDYYLDNFMECLLKKDFSHACDKLRNLKNNSGLNKLEVNVLRNLSIGASNVSDKKIEEKHEEVIEVKEEQQEKVIETIEEPINELSERDKIKYSRLFSHLHMCLANNDFEQGYYTFNRLLIFCAKLDYKDYRLDIIRDLFMCFNFLVDHPELDLNTYNTSYTYDSEDKIKDFYLALNRNDYVNALELCNEINLFSQEEEYDIYKILLERIFNFLNIRMIIRGKNPNMYHSNDNSFVSLVSNKQYKEALNAVNGINIDSHDKNILTSLLESIVDIDNIVV